MQQKELKGPRGLQEELILRTGKKSQRLTKDALEAQELYSSRLLHCEIKLMKLTKIIMQKG